MRSMDHRSGDAPNLLADLRDPFRQVVPLMVDEWVTRIGDGLISLVLFGSLARGEARADSDVDLLAVAGEMPRSLRARREVFLQHWRRLQRERDLPWIQWNLVVKTPTEAVHRSPLYLDMTTDARLLFDRDAFFAHVLDGMRERMRVLGSRKVMMPDGSWYWDLKPDYRFGESVEI